MKVKDIPYVQRFFYIRNNAKNKKRFNEKRKGAVSDVGMKQTINSQVSVIKHNEWDVNLEQRNFVMYFGDAMEGTVDVISEEVKKFLVEVFKYSEEGLDEVVDIRLQYNENLDCPFLVSTLRVRSKYGWINTNIGHNIVIMALSGIMKDIFQVLLQMEISSFHLVDVHEKYVPELRDFLSSNPFLRKLYIGNSYLMKDRVLDQELVWDIFRSSASLLTLAVAHLRFRKTSTKLDQSLSVHLSHIYESQSLKTLDLTHVKRLTPVIIDGIVEGFANKSSPKIKTLDMSIRRYGSHSPVDITKLAKMLRTNDTLEELNLGGRAMANFESILQIAKLLKHNKCLKRLDLRTPFEKCWIHPDTWISVGKALAVASSLQYLDLSGHRISRESWKAFGEGLKANKNLLTLKAEQPYRQWREKETDILLPLFEALRENSTLQSLELSWFNLSESFESLKALGSALIENRTLKSLELNVSDMTDEGAAFLSQSLTQMKGIETLSLYYHNCTVKGAQAFAKGMKNNYSIVSVNFGGHYHEKTGGCLRPVLGADGFEREFHEIEYYARMNRKGRRCIGSETPVDPSLWPLVLAKAQEKEVPIWLHHDLASTDVRRKDFFAGDHDTSIDAVFYLLRDMVRFLVLAE